MHFFIFFREYSFHLSLFLSPLLFSLFQITGTSFSYLAVHLDAVAEPRLSSRIAKGLVDSGELSRQHGSGSGSGSGVSTLWLHRNEPSERHAALCFAHDAAMSWLEESEDQHRTEQDMEMEEGIKPRRTAILTRLQRDIQEARSLCETLERRASRESLSSKIVRLCRAVSQQDRGGGGGGENGLALEASAKIQSELIHLASVSSTTSGGRGGSSSSDDSSGIQPWETSEVLLRRLLTLFASAAYRSTHQVQPTVSGGSSTDHTSGTAGAVDEEDSGMVLWHEEDDEEDEDDNGDNRGADGAGGLGGAEGGGAAASSGNRRGEKTIASLLLRALRQVVENHSSSLMFYEKEVEEEMVLVPGKIRQSLVYSWLMEPASMVVAADNDSIPAGTRAISSSKQKRDAAAAAKNPFSLSLLAEEEEEEEKMLLDEERKVEGEGGRVVAGSLQYPNMDSVYARTEEERLEDVEQEMFERISFTMSASCWPEEEEEEEEGASICGCDSLFFLVVDCALIFLPSSLSFSPLLLSSPSLSHTHTPQTTMTTTWNSCCPPPPTSQTEEV